MINIVNQIDDTDSGQGLDVSHEPIAIVGIGCRFPGGVDGPDAFWRLLSKGADGIIEVPSDRWDVDRFYDPNPATPGKMYVRSGGFLTQKINEFDAFFFGMSPREAGFIDPQQRILMEVAWEALEDAGLDPEKLGGSDTGVYIGGFMLDNLLTQFSPLNRDQIGSHSAVGSTLTILSNRLSYVFDLRGPSITMDTACSSSLVALHEACQSIWRGECALVLCGGVNVMHRPENLIAMCKGGFLSADGRSKSFDKRADGYGRGEGAGIVVLKPYSSALRDGDSIYALVRGTGVNQDGRTEGITVPNPDAQAALMRKVCLEAKINPREIAYVEAHGTGTPLGDPLEAGAIGAVMGRDRSPDDPCVIGSVKANIGHLEAASGVAGLIKLALCLRQGAIPPLANLVEPNPNIPFTELGLRLPLTLESLPPRALPRYMAINSFGYGGTNAHAVLEEFKLAEPQEQSRRDESLNSTRPQVLPLSARSKGALSALAEAHRDLLLKPDGPALRDICYSSALRRGHHDQRVALIADSREAMAAQLQLYIENGAGGGVVAGTVSAQGHKAVFVMTGMGPQTWSMGRELFLTEPVFRAVAEECDEIFQRIAGWSLLKEMLADEQGSRITETQIAQPANFVIQAGLAALWRSWGVEPSAVAGHSVGEVSAAYVAGILTLEDALAVSHHRSRIQKKAAGIGTMLAVGLSTEDIAPYLTPYAGQVSLAAANAPTSITLAGDTDALKQIAAQLQEKGVFNRFLTVEVAYHSPTMEPLKGEVLQALAGVSIQPPRIPIHSTVTGDLAPTGSYDAAYWCRNIREPVYFRKAMGAMIRDGHRIFLEVGPHPVLSTSIKECFAERGVQGVLLASLRRDKPERPTMLEGLAGLYCAGGLLDWTAFHADGGIYTKLPSYPWQREAYWSESDGSLADRVGIAEHALLGRKADLPEPIWDGTLNANLLPYLPDHRVEDLVILPGAAYVEIGLAIDRALHGKVEICLENLEFNKALIISANTQPRLHCVYDSRTRRYRVFSRDREGAAWSSHADGSLSQLPLGQPGRIDLSEIKTRCTEQVSARAHYDDMHRRGLQYGPYFQGVRELWLRPDGAEILAVIEGHAALAQSGHNNLLHPSLLDSCFQCLLAGLGAKGDQNVYVPVKINQVRLYRSPVGRFWCHSTFTAHGENTLEGDVTLCDDDGAILAQVRGVRAQALSNRSQDEIKEIDDWLYQFSWENIPLEDGSTADGRWLIFSDEDSTGMLMADELKAKGAESVIMVTAGSCFEEVSPVEYTIRKDCKADYITLLERTRVASLRGVVYCWALDASLDHEIGTETVLSALYLVQSLAYRQEDGHPSAYFITRNAQPVEREQIDISLEQAPLIGFLRVAQNEFTERRFRMVDFEPSPIAVQQVVSEILSANREEEVSLRSLGRYVNRLSRRSGRELERGLDGKVGSSSTLDTASHKPEAIAASHYNARRKPREGEVEVALGLISLEDQRTAASFDFENFVPNSPRLTGAEAFGVVTAVGPEVDSHQTGDRVMVRLRARPGHFVTVPCRDVYRSKTFGEAGVDPTQITTLSTAYYALRRTARLQKGERVLIHAGTTAIGLAAIEVARWLQATIFVTAETAEQRAYLFSLGLNHVFDSSSSEFVDQIHRITEGRGLEVVLNSFGGEIASKTLGLLGPFGRCVNVGNSLPTQLSFSGLVDCNQVVSNLDIYQFRRRHPEVFETIIEEIGGLILSGHLRHSSTKIIFPSELRDTQDTGKNAPFFGLRFVNFGEVHLDTEAAGKADFERFRSDATYLITGGFGGFGLEVAKWLVSQGVRQVALVSRSGENTSENRKGVQALRAAGANVLPLAGDVSDEQDVARVFTEIAEKMPPLKGIFHAAAVLDDGAIRGLLPSKFEAVMKPKAKGAWLLHQYSRDLTLDHFVLFSSIGSLVGNPGQAPYVAANTFLDTLAHYRRGRGLPAVCINWGALGQIGMAARQKGVEDYLNRMGFGSFTPSQAIKVLDKLLDWKPIGVGAALMHWKVVRKSYPTWAEAPRNCRVFGAIGDEENGTADQGPIDALSKMNAEERQETIKTLFIELISTILRIPAARIEPTQSLLNMGMDSLMGIEIQAAIEKKIGVKVSTLELMKGNSLTDFIQHLARIVDITTGAKLQGKPATDTTRRPDPARIAPSIEDLVSLGVEEVDDMLESLSDAEVEQALELLNEKEDLA